MKTLQTAIMILSSDRILSVCCCCLFPFSLSIAMSSFLSLWVAIGHLATKSFFFPHYLPRILQVFASNIPSYML